MRGRYEGREYARARRRRRVRARRYLVLVALVVVVVAVVTLVLLHSGGKGGAPLAGSSTTARSTSSSRPASSSSTAAAATTSSLPATVSSSAVGSTAPINTSFPGLTMFRGNGSRSFYGTGPVPKNPTILWKFGPMSGKAPHGPLSEPGPIVTWTGTGWTGQPAVAERNGKTWVMFGAYDYKIHFLDGMTGERLLPDFKGQSIFKGSVTLDPDGYPLVYMGNRDNNWRMIAIDRDQPTELWHMNAYDTSPVMWNDDWDGNVVIRNDYAFVPGENGHFFIVKLNRSTGADGKVTVNPQIVLDYPGWTEQELKDIGDKEVSIENSPAVVGDRLYFSNSGGLITGLDISATLKQLKPGEAPPSGKDAFPQVFSYWDGDDTDASIVVDDQGYLYVGIEINRWLPRSKEVGQIIKLDPRKNQPGDNPLVWSVAVNKKMSDGFSGVWATPAICEDMVYVPTHSGSLLGIDRMTGTIVWKKPFTEHAWSSAVVVDDTLIVGDTAGTLHAYDVTDTRVDPPRLWKVTLPNHGAIESNSGRLERPHLRRQPRRLLLLLRRQIVFQVSRLATFYCTITVPSICGWMEQ